MAWTEEEERIMKGWQIWGKRPRSKHVSWGAIDVPVAVLEDRDRAQSAQPTISQALFGDPLPGRSALDRRG